MPTLVPPLWVKPEIPLKIVVLGDSLVYGFGDVSGGGWVERLRRQWLQPDETGHIIYNLGVRGDTAQLVSQRLTQEFCCRGELRHRLPDLMLLSVGVNDTARISRPNGRNHTPFDSFRQTIADLLDQAQSNGPVLFIGMVPVNEARMPFLNTFFYNHCDQHKYKEVTRLACLERQIPYLDIFDLWLSRGTDWCQQQLSQDGLHPNSVGYQNLLADILSWEAFHSQVHPAVSQSDLPRSGSLSHLTATAHVLR